MNFMFHGLVMFKKGINSFSELIRSFEARQTIRSVWMDFVTQPPHPAFKVLKRF